MPENWSWRTRQLLTCRCVSVMLLRPMQSYTKELADAKAENDALRWCCRWSSSVAYQSSLSVSAWSHHAWRDNAASPIWQTPLNGIISPSERGWSLCKNNWKEPRSIAICCVQIERHIDGQPMQLLWAIHTRFQRSIMLVLLGKLSNPFTNVCWVSVLTTFLRRHKFWLHRAVFFAQFQKRRNDGWWFPWCYCCWFVEIVKRLLSSIL